MNGATRDMDAGRVTLVGDAAFCVSLLAGQGSALAMVAAYILAGELHHANGDYTAAFGRYQEIFGPFVLGSKSRPYVLRGHLLRNRNLVCFCAIES